MRVTFVVLHIIAFLIFCTLGLLINFVGWLCCGYCALSSGLVGGLYPCQLEGEANTECPILFATECELKSLQAIWTERCEEEPCRQQQTPRFPKFTGRQKNHATRKIVCQDFVKNLSTLCVKG